MSNNKRIILWCGIAMVLSAIINSFAIYANYRAVAADGSNEMLWSALFFVVPLLVLIFVLMLSSLIGLIFRRSRKICFVIFLCCIVYLGIAMTCWRLADKLRMAAFYKLAERSEPLVRAIKNYKLKYGEPPGSLENLVPEFFPKIPKTGMGAYPEYEYMVGNKAQDFAKNDWCLVVDTPSGGLNWDIFIYLPNQDYPKYGYGGCLEKVRDWAYVYE